MRILSNSPAPTLKLHRLCETISRHYAVRPNPTRSRLIALIAWMVSLFSLGTIICINLGGVSWPLASRENPVGRLGNPGMELLQWFFDGPPPSTSIANFYHYRLTLNRICAINPTRQRGYGLCYNAGPLGSFRFSQYSPDSYIAQERAFDSVVGRIDFFSPFFFYVVAGACCVANIVVLPSCIVIDGAGEARLRNTRVRNRAVAAMCGQALCLALASATLTYSVLHLAKWMQWMPQVSHIWTGTAPLALTWTGTATSILCALVLGDDAFKAHRNQMQVESSLLTSMHKRGRSTDSYASSDALTGYVDSEALWRYSSPRKRLDIENRRKLG
ncbi:MAG: hypothetical protein Q9162_001643 [Coniocarpon cinnabarinum]